MALRAFDFADVALPHAELRTRGDGEPWLARLRDRAERGPAPLCAAAALVERGDHHFAGMLSGLAAYLDAPDVPALVSLGARDALVAVIASRSTPLIVRQAAVDALASLDPSAASLAALGEIAEGGGRENIGLRAGEAHASAMVRADKATRNAAEKLRAKFKLARTWTGIRRQELLRELSTGELHPVAGLLAGDPDFLASLIPPVADDARAALLPALLANAREAQGEIRAKNFALFRGRWRDLAREPLCALGRFASLRGHDSDLPTRAVTALAALGCAREIVIVAATGTAPARTAALAALEQLGARALGDPDRALASEAADHLVAVGEETSAENLRRLVAAH